MQSGGVAGWVSSVSTMDTGGSVGSSLGGAVGKEAGKQLLKFIPFGLGEQIGESIGNAAGESGGKNAALAALGGMEMVRSTSDISFDNLMVMASYLRANYSQQPGYFGVLSATYKIYPELEAIYNNPAMAASQPQGAVFPGSNASMIAEAEPLNVVVLDVLGDLENASQRQGLSTFFRVALEETENFIPKEGGSSTVCKDAACISKASEMAGVNFLIAPFVQRLGGGLFVIQAKIYSRFHDDPLMETKVTHGGSQMDIGAGFTKLAEKLAKDRSNLQTTSLELISNPEDASITLNGRAIKEKTPTTLDAIPVGEYKVEFSKNELSNLEVVSLMANRDEVLSVTLDLAKVQLKVVSDPLGAEVRLNDKVMGHTPFDQEIAVGTYKLTLSAENQLPFEAKIIAKPKTPLQLNEKLKPAGYVLLERLTSGAKVFVGGNPEKPDEKNRLTLPVGPSKVQVFATGFDTNIQSFLVKHGQTSLMDGDLKPIVGKLNIRSNLGSGKVYLRGGDYLPVTEDHSLPLNTLELPIGTYTVEVWDEGYARSSETVEVKFQGVANLDFALAPLPARLTVEVLPEGAKVSLGDAAVHSGATPNSFTAEVPEGQHPLSVTHPSGYYMPYQKKLQMGRGQHVQESIRLDYTPAYQDYLDEHSQWASSLWIYAGSAALAGALMYSEMQAISASNAKIAQLEQEANAAPLPNIYDAKMAALTQEESNADGHYKKAQVFQLLFLGMASWSVWHYRGEPMPPQIALNLLPPRGGSDTVSLALTARW